MNPTNTPLDITLGGKSMTLYFDINSFKAFEKASGKFYMNWLTKVMEDSQVTAIELAAEAEDENISFAVKQISRIRLAGIVGMTDFEAIIWAAYHTPGRHPRWPMSIEEVGELIDEEAYFKLVPQILTAILKNTTSKKKSSEQPDAEAEAPRPTNPSLETPSTSGGKISGDSDDIILDSLTKKSES